MSFLLWDTTWWVFLLVALSNQPKGVPSKRTRPHNRHIQAVSTFYKANTPRKPVNVYTLYGCGSKRVPKWHLGTCKQRLKPYPSCSILSHKHTHRLKCPVAMGKKGASIFGLLTLKGNSSQKNRKRKQPTGQLGRSILVDVGRGQKVKF